MKHSPIARDANWWRSPASTYPSSVSTVPSGYPVLAAQAPADFKVVLADGEHDAFEWLVLPDAQARLLPIDVRASLQAVAPVIGDRKSGV
jgi:hypothetical protein